VPLYQIGLLRVLADEGHELVDTYLMRIFEALAELHKERLSPSPA